MKRLDPSVGSSLWTLGVIVGVGLLLSVITFVPAGTQNAVNAGPGSGSTGGDGTSGDGGDGGAAGGGTTGGGTTGGGGTSGGGGSRTSGGGGTGPVRQSQADVQGCAQGKNAGNSDTGVTASNIKLAATVVDDGPGASFLAPVRVGMKAVQNKVNRAGGICGRKLELILRNDSWDARLGSQFIQNFVESEKVFALAVVPSSEGLLAADSYIQQKKVPVVGTDGMLIHQYRNPWIWPVATSTISTMHIMAKNAADRGSKHFGIVFDAKYHFGVEGAFAFNEAVKRLSPTKEGIPGFDASLKKCVRRFCGIQPGKSAYTQEAQGFNRDCYDTAPRCDFVGFLLEPDTARVFMNESRTGNPIVGFGGAQPLFNRAFAENCGASCNNMWVWTGYNPPIESIATQPAVAGYVNDVKAESDTADVNNQFLEGGYIGMRLLVEALTKTGPNLTRENLKNVLDNMTFDSGLSQPLTWKAGNHFANTAARPFVIQYRAQFNGWRVAGDFIQDPWVGQDAP